MAKTAVLQLQIYYNLKGCTVLRCSPQMHSPDNIPDVNILGQGTRQNSPHRTLPPVYICKHKKLYMPTKQV